MPDSELPWGETRLDPADIPQLIDTETAIEILREEDVPRSEERVRNFVGAVPSILQWLEDHGRDYPWRHITDPWRIYLTEILLQRTRADAVADIYEEFFSRFPDPESLYQADEEEIQDTVESLGFVNHRTRTLSEVARLCREEYSGEVPEDVDELQRPWRVGPYVAHAVQLFARNRPAALVDANTARVVGQALTYPMPDQPHKNDDVRRLMETLNPSEGGISRAYNLALIDLGALVFRPDIHNTDMCPLQKTCPEH